MACREGDNEGFSRFGWMGGNNAKIVGVYAPQPAMPRAVGPEPSAAHGAGLVWRMGRNALWALTIVIVAWKCIQTGPYFFVEQYAPPPPPLQVTPSLSDT